MLQVTKFNPAPNPSFTMVTKSKLKMALAAEKGTDFKKLKLKRKQKDAARQSRKAAGRGAVEEKSSDEEEEEEKEEEVVDGAEEDEEEEGHQVCCFLRAIGSDSEDH